ncbi:MAG: AAA family ATPase, partial [Gemmataceae bacterium]
MRKNAYANRSPAVHATLLAEIVRAADAGPRFAAPHLIVLAGLPGGGKSTLASALRAATGVTILESDAIRKRLYPIPTYADWEHRKVFALVREAATRLLTRGHPAVVDATNLRRKDRLTYYAMAARL